MPKVKTKKGISTAELYCSGNLIRKKATNAPPPEDSASNKQGNSADLLKFDVCTSTVEYVAKCECCTCKKWHCYCVCGNFWSIWWQY